LAARSSQSHFIRTKVDEAIALQRRGNHKGAAKRLQRVLKKEPEHPQLLNMYAISLSELGETAKAGRVFQKATRTNPEHAESWSNYGAFLHSEGDLEAALSAFGRCGQLNPEYVLGLRKYADILLEMERYAEALAAFEAANSVDPEDGETLRGLSHALMFAGKWQRALDAAEKALPKLPGNSRLLSIMSVAYAELGRTEDEAKLVDFGRLIDVKDLSVPDGYADMKTFNDALCTHCLAHPSLVYEPGGKATKKGHQSDNLLTEKNEGPIAPLLEMVVNAVREYRDSRPIDATHPFLAQRPRRWGCYMWATILDSQGQQASHLHPSGWVSGVYYPRIPDVVAENPDSHAGWIEFGRAAKYPHAKAEHPVKLYQPKEGRVVLFPSYFYHRTEPFESDQQRISIAFDMVPFA
jgi:tetratricopeptide (TPR) repeat protein